ncbi:adenylate/guanylate cyclase domain-containing protein [Treponema sp. OMZ 840]|uniref:adenylate/guanylate cyclase domain-containing protein n=1 Tax=Treponema sp. OMZ 840 TaxID=244313 RepID=UPI003D8B948C
MEKIKKSFFYLFLLFVFTCFAQTPPASFYVDAEKASSVIALNTDFDIYFDFLFTSLQTEQNPSSPLKAAVPSNWNKQYSEFKGEKTAYGYATYRLLLQGIQPGIRYAFYMKYTPSASCVIYVDGKQIVSAGQVSASEENFKPAYKPMYAEFTASNRGEAELVIQVANWTYRKGGLWTPVYFGKQNVVYRYYNTSAGITFFICAMLLFLVIVCFTIFALNVKKHNSLYLGLFLFSLAIRMSITGFNIASLIFENFPYALAFKLEYSVLWLAPTAFLYFLYSMFTWAPAKRLKYAYGIFQLTLGVLSIVLPISIVNRMVPLFEIGTVLGALYCGILLIIAFLKKEKRVFMYSVSLFVVALAVLYEIAYLSIHGTLVYSFIPLAFLILAIVQFFTLAAQETSLFSDRVVLIHKLKKLNDAYVRFVPREFLDLLNKKNITDVALGDYVQRDMGILFSQIYIKSDGEEISLEEQYDIFSTFSMVVSLLMPQYKGFVSKFLSRGIIALFPSGTQDAVNCSFEIQERIDKLNEIRRSAGRPPVSVAMGIHYGRMILGTIGEISRLDDTVISDAVNTAARIESVAEKLKSPVLVSLEAVEKSDLAKNPDIALIPLGNIHIKGRVKLVSLFKCLPLEPFREKLAQKIKRTVHIGADKEQTYETI